MTARWWRTGSGGLAVLAVLLGLAAVAPEPVVLGAVRLAALSLAVAGAAALVSRAGALDLATAAAMAVGAYAGGVGTALLAAPVALGLPAGGLAGAAVGATSGALHGRVGRGLGALTSLALGLAVVAAVAAWPAGGGVAGFHAVGLPTPFGDRADLVAVGAVLLLGLAGAHRLVTSGIAAASSVAVRSPVVAASLGRRPWRDGLVLGAGSGALLGLGGTTLAAVDGSVLPAAYGLELAAGLALGAALGGSVPFGPVVGTLVVWGPGTLWPLVPLVGTAPPLLVMGPVGLAVLGLRRGRPLVGAAAPPSAPGTEAAGPLSPSAACSLEVEGAATPSGPAGLHVAPGEVVALVGPNGAGKSTLLARIAGQLPDAGTVRFGGEGAPHGPIARARAGVGRTWQRPPRLPAADAEAVAVGGRPERAAAALWASEVLGGAAGDPGIAQLVRLAAIGPAVALVDEPTDVAPDRLLALLRGLAGAGTAVVVVDHRPEIAAAADRVVPLGQHVGEAAP